MGNYKHLSLTERCIIERCLTFGYSMKETAKQINRNPTTVSREVKNHRTFIKNRKIRCASNYACKKHKICGNNICMPACKTCLLVDCREVCDDFAPIGCKKLDRPPYVCNNCTRQDFCEYEHAYYNAHKANAAYLSELSASRKGARVDDEKLAQINALITPLLRNGQSLSHIFSYHADELTCSRKTIYNYIDRCLFDARNIDLPRKVRYKRRKTKPAPTAEYQYRIGRTYDDFKAYIKDNPDVGVVEMDTVKSGREKGKVLLTMILVKYDFMFIFLLDSATQECVEEVFAYLQKAFGLAIFRRTFPVILTDNGGEFKNPRALENTRFGAPCTQIFYCDPMASWQKPHIERNHTFIRRVIPKGNSLDNFTQADMTLLANHINSVARDSLGGECPYAVARKFLGPKIPHVLGLRRIEPDNVILKPTLLK